MDFYVYLHRKKTTGEVFYVGKGKENRAWEKSGRNKYWKHIASKHGYTVEIYQNNLQEWYALELEQELILRFGRLVDNTGSLCNITCGGESGSGESNGRYDHTVWTFYNSSKDITVKATRQEFLKKYPGTHLNGVFSDKNREQQTKGWVVLERVSEEYLEALKANFKKKYSPRSDKKIYTFVNIDSGEIFIGKRWEMEEKYEEVDTKMIIGKFKKTSKRWALKEVYDSVGKEKLQNPFGGLNSHKADQTVYSFTNLATGEVFNGTRYEFSNYIGKEVGLLFCETKTPKVTVAGWCLSGNVEIAKKLSRNDYTKYNFVHKDGTVFYGTKIEFKNFTGLCPSTLFQTRANKTCKGWSLAPAN